ncbi:YhgE/Pip family protein [Streptomyces thermolineatus]|uniref:YhgE/Pip family protein n=1 Tax=Streptomyces thermolineatus TaxID=44033 RepID=UPI0038514A4E
MRTPRLAALELRRFGRGRLPRAAMAALLLLPLLYGALYLWSFWDPYSRLDKIPVALVNKDRGATADGKRVTAGDDLVEGLLGSGTFDWQQVDAGTAAQGLEEGSYYLTLTVPEDFSESIASSSGAAPRAGSLKVRTNDSNNYVVGQISRSVFSEVRSAASAKSSRQFYEKIFLSFSDLHDGTEKAAKGADDVTDGAGDARKGSKDLGNGIDAAKDGSGRLADGLEKAEKGSGDLADGLDSLHDGAGDLAEGARQVADGTQQVADRVNGFADDAGPLLDEHGKEIGEAARAVADGTERLGDDLDALPADAGRTAREARTASDRLDASYAARCGSGGSGGSSEPGGSGGSSLLPESPLGADPSCPGLKKAAEAADEAAGLAEQLDGLVEDNTTSLDRLRKDLDSLNAVARKVADSAPGLSGRLDKAVADVNRLNKGAHKVADGADDLAAGVGKAGAGADSLEHGVTDLSDGAASLNGGMYRLADGSNRLTDGLGDLTDGAGRLADGLHEGAEKIPDYDAQERGERSKVMSDPVRLASDSLHKAANYGTGFAPYFIPLSLWVGAMVGYMLIPPMNRRALSAGAPAWRIAVSGWLPVAAVGVLQVAALMSVLHWGLGLRMARAAGTVAFLVVVVMCFSSIVQWLNARFGAAGRVLVLAVLMLQLTSAGGTYPVQTSPGFFNVLHPLLPMSYVVDGLRHLITGGGLWPVWRAVIVLLAFTAGALALTAWSARRKQVWTVDRLHPELSL